METLPLSKVKKMLDFWTEITLTPDQREKRMREVADKASQKVFEELILGKVKIEKDQVKDETGTLDRFASLGLDPSMFEMKSPQKEN